MGERFKEILSILKTLFSGTAPVPEAEAEAASNGTDRAAEWAQLFRGNAPWLTDPAMKSLGLPAAIAGEIARLATVELSGHVAGSARAEYLDAQLQPVLAAMRVQCEYAAACGGIILKPYVTGGAIAVDFVQPENFIPVRWDARGVITDAVFIEQRRQGGAWYTRLEYHTLQPDGCFVHNTAFVSRSRERLGTKTPLSAVPEWSALAPEWGVRLADGSAPCTPLFCYLRIPFANQTDPASPLGVSVYSRAVSLIEEADRQYNRILWEYEGSELAVDASVGALQIGGREGFSMPRHQKRLFRELAVDKGDGGDLYSVFSPQIRDESLFSGLNNLLRRIEFACCLSYGTLSDPENVAKTAEEIKMSRQRSYSAVADIEKSMENALHALVDIMNTYATLYHLAPEGAYEASFRFGDSVVTDTAAEREQMRRDCLDGAAAWWEYRMRFYGEPEETARERAAQAAQAQSAHSAPETAPAAP